MSYQRYLSILLITIFLIIVMPSMVYPEYLRATKEDELILVSTEKEVSMGESLSKKVEKQFGVLKDQLVQQGIDAIGQNIAKICDRRDISYHFTVIVGQDLRPEQQINAFALPGGYIYIFKGLLDRLEDDNEIAGVLAHEVAHICAKHNIKRLQSSLGATALQILTSQTEADGETKARANSAIALLMLAYSREDEFLADKLGVKYMKLAGYNPQGAVRVVEKLIDIQRKSPIKPYSGYRTHPYLAERKAVIRNEIRGELDFVDFINMP